MLFKKLVKEDKQVQNSFANKVFFELLRDELEIKNFILQQQQFY